MINDELTLQILQQLPFTPTQGQCEAIDVFSRFMTARGENEAMVLRGSAGTGKTSVARAIVRVMCQLKQKVVLLAPTGRAAKVFALGADHHAFTIHRHIYRQKQYTGLGGQFNLGDNKHTDTLFIIDEASMINMGEAYLGGSTEGMFGTGNLLDDLVRYVYSGRNCRMMLIGDAAQLPPVGADEAPALLTEIVSGYGLQVWEYDLMEVLRQSSESGILWNATMIRHLITTDDITGLPRIRFQGFADIQIVPGNEIIEQLSSSYSHVGMDETTVITRSNKHANIYNMGIRSQVIGYEDQLCTGEQLMIVKNNYYWMEKQKEAEKEASGNSGAPVEETGSGAGEAERVAGEAERVAGEAERSAVPAFLANGDRCVVQRVRNLRELYGFHYADVWLQLPDYDDYELKVTMILDTLLSDAPALTREQQEKIFNNVMEDYSDIPTKPERLKRLKEDAVFNALQVKYAYAVTCHKAQGGQWAHVYVDQGYMTDDMLTPSYIRWLYTAFTRATEHLYLINWPETQVG